MSQQLNGFKDPSGNKYDLPNPEEFAPADHSHTSIHNSTGGNSVTLDDDGEISIGATNIVIAMNGVQGDIEIDENNADNLKRILDNPAFIMEQYRDSEAMMEDSDVVGTILDDGIRLIKYKPTSSNPERYYVMLVRHYISPVSAQGANKYNVEQVLITNDGILTRRRAFEIVDGERGAAYNSWSEWSNIIPQVTQYIVENDTNPVSSGAVYTALQDKSDTNHNHDSAYAVINHNHAGVYAAANHNHDGEYVKPSSVMPSYAVFDGTPIDMDAVITDENGMARLFILNGSGSTAAVAGLLISSDDLPIHINKAAETTDVLDGEYVILTIFKIDKNLAPDHSHDDDDYCYFVAIEGVFDDGSVSQQ